VDENTYYFSISHSWPYVAVMVSLTQECGIDIQTWHPRIQKIQHKFLSAEEQSLFNNDTKLLTSAWCAKEAAYKWQGRRGVEFIDHLPIISLEVEANKNNIVILCKLMSSTPILTIKALLEPSFSCGYVEKSRISENNDI